MKLIGFLVMMLSLSCRAFAAGPEMVVVTPSTFDFGWSPDNSKITAEFSIKNTGVEVIPITGVQTTCGCTASQFTPGNLASNEETKVSLTFNTRGYLGTAFNKSAKVKTAEGAAEYSVQLKGFVGDPQSPVVPDNEGVVGFEPRAKEKKKVLNISNKSLKDMTLNIVQMPASWANVKLATKNVKAGASVPLEVSLEGSNEETRDTSLTLEAVNEEGAHRLTIAIRTGTPPPPTKRSSTSGAPVPTSVPAPTPK
ncbi:MAG: hypothetical protein KCHDKBKB_02594 [Elusimicrobia bacterium]|nr:hypothetical protein [Elusimicrobiota bacterium]